MMDRHGPNLIVATPPSGDSSHRVADTEFVALAVAAVSAAIPGPTFASGTRIVFQQTAAPTGWTKITTFNDAALRIVSGTASSGGTNGFSTVMAQTTVGSHTLTTSEIPAHTHTYDKPTFTHEVGAAASGVFASITTTSTASGSTGTGSGHDHTITMDMKYTDVIVCQKD